MRLLLPRSSSQIQKSNPLSDRRVLSCWYIQQDLFPQELQCRKALSKAWPLRARTLSVRVLLPRRIIHSHAVPGWQVLSRRLLEAEILHPRAVPEQQAVRPAQHQQQARHHSAAGLRSAADVRPAQPARRLHLLHRPRGRVRPLLLRHQRVPAPPAPAPHLSQDHPSQPPHQPAHDAARHAAPAALPHLPAGPLGGPVLRRRLRQLPVRPVPGGPLLPRVRRHHRPLPGRQLLPGRLLGARPVPRRLLLRARVQGARAVPGGPQVPARRHRPEEVRLSAAAAEDRGADPPGPPARGPSRGHVRCSPLHDSATRPRFGQTALVKPGDLPPWPEPEIEPILSGPSRLPSATGSVRQAAGQAAEAMLLRSNKGISHPGGSRTRFLGDSEAAHSPPRRSAERLPRPAPDSDCSNRGRGIRPAGPQCVRARTASPDARPGPAQCHTGAPGGGPAVTARNAAHRQEAGPAGPGPSGGPGDWRPCAARLRLLNQAASCAGPGPVRAPPAPILPRALVPPPAECRPVAATPAARSPPAARRRAHALRKQGRARRRASLSSPPSRWAAAGASPHAPPPPQPARARAQRHTGAGARPGIPATVPRRAFVLRNHGARNRPLLHSFARRRAPQQSGPPQRGRQEARPALRRPSGSPAPRRVFILMKRGTRSND